MFCKQIALQAFLQKNKNKQSKIPNYKHMGEEYLLKNSIRGSVTKELWVPLTISDNLSESIEQGPLYTLDYRVIYGLATKSCDSVSEGNCCLHQLSFYLPHLPLSFPPKYLFLET